MSDVQWLQLNRDTRLIGSFSVERNQNGVDNVILLNWDRTFPNELKFSMWGSGDKCQVKFRHDLLFFCSYYGSARYLMVLCLQRLNIMRGSGPPRLSFTLTGVARTDWPDRDKQTFYLRFSSIEHIFLCSFNLLLICDSKNCHCGLGIESN